MARGKKATPFLLWPFVAIWNLIAYIVSLTGRIVAVALGLASMVLGVVISITIIGAVVGIPLFVFGLLLIVRGLW